MVWLVQDSVNLRRRREGRGKVWGMLWEEVFALILYANRVGQLRNRICFVPAAVVNMNFCHLELSWGDLVGISKGLTFWGGTLVEDGVGSRDCFSTPGGGGMGVEGPGGYALDGCSNYFEGRDNVEVFSVGSVEGVVVAREIFVGSSSAAWDDGCVAVGLTEMFLGDWTVIFGITGALCELDGVRGRGEERRGRGCEGRGFWGGERKGRTDIIVRVMVGANFDGGGISPRVAGEGRVGAVPGSGSGLDGGGVETGGEC
ncbi:hypothetical protein Tco_0717646 [Tanacetum coccineum]